MADNMSIDALSNNLVNPARSYLWEMIIPKPVGGDSEMMTIRCRSTTMPGKSFGDILIPYKQTAGVKFPGKLSYTHTIDFTFNESEDRATYKGLVAWTKEIIDDKSGYSIGGLTYKTDIYLNLLNTDGAIAMTIRLLGCYCQSVSDVALSYDDDKEITFSSTFSYDRWEIV